MLYHASMIADRPTTGSEGGKGWRTPGDLLAAALICCVGAMLAVAAAFLVSMPPMPSYGPPRNQTPVAWATAVPTPTMRPFAPVAKREQPNVYVRDRCFSDVLRGPWCPVTAPPMYGSLTEMAHQR